MMHAGAIVAGFVLDMLVGDPHWLPHPVRWIGALISWCEKALRAIAPGSAGALKLAGAVLVVVVAGVACACAALFVHVCALLDVRVQFAAEALLCYQMLAAKSLRVESMKVYRALAAGDLDGARHAVSMIVGRDTDQLDERGVASAAVESVAENASDGVMAPLLFMGLFGPVGAVFYKAVNTMDSMVGYKNERYLHFGRAAAKLDDALNFIPARVTGLVVCAVAGAVSLDAHGAWRVFAADRRKHASPNSACGEAACAGALGIQLGGTSSYFGKPVKKPVIGQGLRQPEAGDIVRANALLRATAVAGLLLAVLMQAGVMLLAGRILG